MKKILILTSIVLLLAACIPSQAQVTFVPVTYTPDVNVIVAQTFAALTAEAALTQPANGFTQIPTLTSTPEGPTTATVTATPVPGFISGALSYPSSFIPPLRVVAFQVNGFNYQWVDTMQNQSTYQIAGLAPGLYHVVAYIMDGTYAGGYTQMVPCGLQASCTDHSLIDVEVKSGQDTPNINPGDWYAPAGTFPPMP
ncbi:MAG: hypothetical protein C4583_01080 [Anaerolineaceae bacterium]|nr:MAG: hypothetical protein C4583_01080 [Anaerolineaceae bacterium]